MAKNSSLIIRAGPRALAHIREHGLRAQDVEIIPGAAGGPKALGLQGLDMALFGEWLPGAPRVRHLLGASIGAWRFACAAQKNQTQALRRFAELYVAQHFPAPIDKRYVTQCCQEMVHELFDDTAEAILHHPHYRLSILAVRGRGMLAKETRGTIGGLVAAAAANSVSRAQLRHFFSRAVFHDTREKLPILHMDGNPSAENNFDTFHTDYIPLSKENLSPALLASGSIPTVLEGVMDIPGAPMGTYWDGGIIDYHIHWPYHRAKGLVLYPHFTDKIIPGWLDKSLPWRKATGDWLDNVVLISPSKEYLTHLPYGKLPDRSNFKKFVHDPAARMRYWRTAIAESERLGQEFLESTQDNKMLSVIRPI
ncbi:MAG: patatin-like phospholipase family protein [Burkholderiales bacterium]